jgi:hypothetical protein
MILAPAIAFIVADGFARNFGPWEKTMLAALWLTPLVARSIAQISLIPLGAAAMLAIFALILHRSGFGLAVAFSDPATTLHADSGGVSQSQDCSQKNRGHDIAALKS